MSSPIERILPPEDDFDPEEVERVGADGLLRRGVELFNSGEYHQAHEEWEKVWIAGEAGDDDFWKGLIQAAIALHHFERGELEGARKLYRGHRAYLAEFLPAHRGVQVEQLLTDMQSFMRAVLRAAPDASIEFDAQRAPRLEFLD